MGASGNSSCLLTRPSIRFSSPIGSSPGSSPPMTHRKTRESIPTPDPVERLSESDIFGRGGRIRSVWGWRVAEICRPISRAQGSRIYGSMVYSEETRWMVALDGGCSYKGGWGGGIRGWRLSGTRLRRYVLYRLGAEQPPRKQGEESVPTLAELEAEVAAARAIQKETLGE